MTLTLQSLTVHQPVDRGWGRECADASVSWVSRAHHLKSRLRCGKRKYSCNKKKVLLRVYKNYFVESDLRVVHHLSCGVNPWQAKKVFVAWLNWTHEVWTLSSRFVKKCKFYFFAVCIWAHSNLDKIRVTLRHLNWRPFCQGVRTKTTTPLPS